MDKESKISNDTIAKETKLMETKLLYNNNKNTRFDYNAQLGSSEILENSVRPEEYVFFR